MQYVQVVVIVEASITLGATSKGLGASVELVKPSDLVSIQKVRLDW